jgi:hypothetical protein
MNEDQKIIKQLECEKLKHERDNEYSIKNLDSLRSQYTGKYLYFLETKIGELNVITTDGLFCHILLQDHELSVSYLRQLLCNIEHFSLREE